MLYKICPVFVFYTDKFLPVGMGGNSYVFGPFCFMLIRNEFKHDEGIHNHEMVHVKQHWRTWWLHHFKYSESDKYRFESEVEAYAHQYASYPNKKHFDIFVDFMLDKYNLPFSKDIISSALLRAIKELQLPAPI